MSDRWTLDRAEEIRSQLQPCHDLRGFGQLAQSVFQHPSASVRAAPVTLLPRGVCPGAHGGAWPWDRGMALLPGADGARAAVLIPTEKMLEEQGLPSHRSCVWWLLCASAASLNWALGVS